MAFFKKMSCFGGGQKEAIDVLADYDPVPSTSSATVAMFCRKNTNLPELMCDVFEIPRNSPENVVEAEPEPVKKSVMSRLAQRFRRMRSKRSSAHKSL